MTECSLFVHASVQGGLALLVLMFAAERAVLKIHALADLFGFSFTFTGLTIFSMTTSLPEIFAHLTASANILAGTMDYRIASGTVLGANIGSDVIQQTLILGLVVLLMGGMKFSREFFLTAYLPMIGTTLLCIILGWDGTYSRLDGSILLGTFFVYMLYLYHREDRNREKGYFYTKDQISVPWDCTIALICMLFFDFLCSFFAPISRSACWVYRIGSLFNWRCNHWRRFCCSRAIYSYFRCQAKSLWNQYWNVDWKYHH